jgi:hypothetical protein
MRKPVRKVRVSTSPKPKPGTRTATTAKAPTKTLAKKRPGASAKAGSGKGFDRGATGFNRARGKREKQEEEYQRMVNTPYDFRIKPGEEAEVVVVDTDEPFFVSLHKVKNSRGYWEDAVCIADTGQACPLCEEEGKDGSYTMVLTCIDKRPYKDKQGKLIKNSKRLLKVKGRNLAKFERQYKSRKGNYRGMKIMCRRDGDKDAAIGEDLDFNGTVKEVILKKMGDLAVPADYASIFEIPSADEVRKRYNLGRTKVAGAEEFDDSSDGDYDMDDVGW